MESNIFFWIPDLMLIDHYYKALEPHDCSTYVGIRVKTLLIEFIKDCWKLRRKHSVQNFNPNRQSKSIDKGSHQSRKEMKLMQIPLLWGGQG